jgi:predicted metal-dependent hydrolase
MSITVQLAFDFGPAHEVGGESGRSAAEVQAVFELAAAPVTSAVSGVQARPLDYTLKVSRRARRVYLRVVPGRGLVITIPRRFPRRQIPALIEEQRGWIEQSLVELDALTPDIYRRWPPETLNLAACAAVVRIIIQPVSPGQVASACWLSPVELQLFVAVDDKVAVAECVATALKARARTVLVPWLARLAQRHGFCYQRAAIRGQRTLWGSYSSSGTLSLNYKLLFLSPDVVDYVLLHELTHTRYLDHSPAFWRLLEAVQPGARELDEELGDLGALVPPWLELAH